MIDIQKLINEHGGGALLVEINESMQKVIKDCCDTGKKGDITLKLGFEPLAIRDGGHQVKITPNVTTKNPKYDAGVGIFYVVTDAKYDAGVGIFYVVTDENEEPVGLEAENPRQTKLWDSVTKEVNS